MTAEAKAGALVKAATLIEALPWLEQFHGETVVIKFGGHAMADEALCFAFAQDVVFLVTTPETMDVVRMVLTGQVNRDVVGQINRHGPFALGMSGEDANLLTATRALATVDGAPVDIGQVGEIHSVDPGAVRTLIADGRIPVISSVARGGAGEVFNVNADTAAAAIAVALGAAKLVLLTDVAGLYADWPGSSAGGPASSDPAADRPGEVISQLDAAGLAAMMPGLSDGMIPKMEACLTAVRGGVPRAHVLDGRLPHAILLEIFTDSGIGTMVVPAGAGS